MALLHTIIGTFAFDRQHTVIDRGSRKEMEKKHGKGEVAEADLTSCLKSLRTSIDFHELQSANLAITKKDISASVSNENLIIQTINNIDDITKVLNMLIKRLREWYSLHNPEFSESIQNQEKFTSLIQTKTREELLQELNITDSMGKPLDPADLEPMMKLAQQITALFALQKSHETYIEKKMRSLAPNMTAVAGPIIGARLIGHAGTLKRLMEMPASTIQLLGAEKALFRHLVTGAKCPKFGVIYNHPLVSTTKNKGRAARLIADKICLAAKVDYFKGEFIGERLRTELEKKIS